MRPSQRARLNRVSALLHKMFTARAGSGAVNKRTSAQEMQWLASVNLKICVRSNYTIAGTKHLAKLAENRHFIELYQTICTAN